VAPSKRRRETSRPNFWVPRAPDCTGRGLAAPPRGGTRATLQLGGAETEGARAPERRGEPPERLRLLGDPFAEARGGRGRAPGNWRRPAELRSPPSTSPSGPGAKARKDRRASRRRRMAASRWPSGSFAGSGSGVSEQQRRRGFPPDGAVHLQVRRLQGGGDLPHFRPAGWRCEGVTPPVKPRQRAGSESVPSPSPTLP